MVRGGRGGFRVALAPASPTSAARMLDRRLCWSFRAPMEGMGSTGGTCRRDVHGDGGCVSPLRQLADFPRVRIAQRPLHDLPPAPRCLEKEGRPGLIRPQVFRGAAARGRPFHPTPGTPIDEEGASWWFGGVGVAFGLRWPPPARRPQQECIPKALFWEGIPSAPWRAGVDRGHLPAGYSRSWSVYVPSAAARRVPPI